MDIKHMKNIVVLRDLPSNMVEEAFIILKDNVKGEKLIEKKKNTNIKNTINKQDNLIDKNKKNNVNNKNKKCMNNKEYIIKEAEMIINDYISKIEENSIKSTNEKMKLQEKNRRLKYSNIFFILFSIFSIISIVIR